MDMTIRKEIIFEAFETSEINKQEVQLIMRFQSNNPEIGYNRLPKYKNSFVTWMQRSGIREVLRKGSAACILQVIKACSR